MIKLLGFLNIDKPAGMTSREVVDRVERRIRPLKVGHAGTLDPLAQGVLVVAIGQATRLVSYVQQSVKSYRATFLLGYRSDTEDVEGPIEPIPDAPIPMNEQIYEQLPRFLGTIAQRPPTYSAIWIQGRRAYELARRGEAVELAPRPVTIHRLRVINYEYPRLELEIECGSGTYVRALGRDLASQLGTGAVMSKLVRTAVGPFLLERAVQLEQLDELHRERWAELLIPPGIALSWLPAITISQAEADVLRTGGTIERFAHGIESEGLALLPPHTLVAIVVPRDGDRLRPKMNFSV